MLPGLDNLADDTISLQLLALSDILLMVYGSSGELKIRVLIPLPPLYHYQGVYILRRINRISRVFIRSYYYPSGEYNYSGALYPTSTLALVSSETRPRYTRTRGIKLYSEFVLSRYWLLYYFLFPFPFQGY